MLTLTRKVGETIRIGDKIQIVVKEIRKNQVRIGIIAPRDIKIFREEVYQNIVRENQESAQANVDAVDALELDLVDDDADRATSHAASGTPGRQVSTINGGPTDKGQKET